MTTVTKTAMSQGRQFGNSPFGNASRIPFRFETNASGVMLDSDQSTAVLNTQVVVLGTLPAGFTMEDCVVNISDAFAGSTTASIGFAYADGVDTTPAQDAAYFASALSTASTGISRKTGIKAPIKLPKDANLILTIGGADHSAAGIMDITVVGVNSGG